MPSRNVGGDYYDYFPVGHGCWAFVIADVSGKGAGAALIMAACRMALRSEAQRHPSPAALLAAVNRLLHPDMPSGMFISIIFLRQTGRVIPRLPWTAFYWKFTSHLLPTPENYRKRFVATLVELPAKIYWDRTELW